MAERKLTRSAVAKLQHRVVDSMNDCLDGTDYQAEVLLDLAKALAVLEGMVPLDWDEEDDEDE